MKTPADDNLKPYNPRNTKHGAYTKNPTLYGVWATMKHRCEDKKRAKYKDYGARGIKVCNAWQEPNAFIEWALANGYKKGLQLDRKDNDGDYSPNNCRWVTPKENSRNRRNTILLTVGDKTMCVSAWCEIKDVSPFTVYWWVREKGREYAEQRLFEIT